MTDCKDCRLVPTVALAATSGTAGGRPPIGLRDEIRVHKTTQSSAPAACSLSYNVYQTSEQYVSSELTTAPYETVELTTTPYETVELTSSIYPLEFMDSLAPAIAEPSVSRKLGRVDMPIEVLGVGLVAPAVSRKTAVRYLTYTATETLNVGLVAPSIKRESIIRRLRYEDAEPEALTVGLVQPSVKRKTHPTYKITDEALTVGLVAPTIKRTNT